MEGWDEGTNRPVFTDTHDYCMRKSELETWSSKDEERSED